MAAFPNSVKSFTTKNAGDVIQSAHVNDAQDEINAIEAGYLNGTAPLNSSRATPAALSVAGGSTLATLTVTGNSTFGGSLSVAGGSTMFALQCGASTFSVRPITPPPDIAVVFIDSTRTLGSSAASTIAFNAQSILTNSSMHSTGANPERISPQSTGLYQISGQVALTAGDGGRDLSVVDSSGTRIATETRSSGATAPFLNVTGYKRFDAVGGYVTMLLTMSGASTLSVSTGIGGTWLSMVKL